MIQFGKILQFNDMPASKRIFADVIDEAGENGDGIAKFSFWPVFKNGVTKILVTDRRPSDRKRATGGFQPSSIVTKYRIWGETLTQPFEKRAG